MKSRIEFLAGLLEEDDDEFEIRRSIVEEYENDFAEDAKVISENVRVLEEDDYRFNKMLGFEEESSNGVLNENSYVAPSGEYTIAHGHGLGPGFSGFQSNSEPFDPYKGVSEITNKWILGKDDETIQEDAPVLPGEMVSHEDMDLLPPNAIDALEDLAAGSDVLLHNDDNVRDELIARQMVAVSPAGGFEVTEKGLAYLQHVSEGFAITEAYEGGVPGDIWFYDQTGNQDGGYVRFREDPYNERPMRAHHEPFPKPAGWTFYGSDHTNQRLEAQRQDPLDEKEEESVKDYIQKFFDKNSVKK